MKASAVALTAAAAVACEPGDQPPTGPTEPNLASTSSVHPGTVSDLRVTAASDTSVTLAFTEVDDGTGQPASYDIRLAAGALSWGSSADMTRGSCASPVVGSGVAATRSCTGLGLT